MNVKFLTGMVSAFAVAAALSGEVRAQALVINGEEIADAKLMAAAKTEGRLDIYGAYPTEAIQPVLDGFQKDTGLKLEYVRIPSSRMYDRVLAEFASGKLDADYADLTDLTLIKEWVSRGILAAHKVPWHDRIASELKHPDGRWYYIVRPIYVIGVNTAEVAEKDYPKTWKETLDPKWKGKVGMQAIDAGGSAVTLHSFMRIKLGENTWAQLRDNEPRLQSTIAPVVNDLVRGRTPLAYVDANSIVAQSKDGAPLKAIFPAEGVPGFGAFGNVTSTTKRPNAAKVWVNYVTSKRGSTLMASGGAYGTHPDAAPPSAPGMTFPPQNQVWTIQADLWDKIQEPWQKEWKDIVLKK
jgi:iron(III) transport system substrate-binding protein